ncbi:hypothetical protein M427DRAFT_147540 [Gonapodya prolifera JEL478]|uniref:Uncharacterized protein n=1 Tax=Gonapodya prolifera (strain JEL478) TaxID=1344416 RepID=A0A139A4T1_GONPJ|nr:hypothetical protein M427DRAFT_147540 [Gonapodya prolifera JEL478]|eukprot:KXS11817.1 hypothetical protein M427DRAFT_147540 [Gonapodya prolifera JEL478]
MSSKFFSVQKLTRSRNLRRKRVTPFTPTTDSPIRHIPHPKVSKNTHRETCPAKDSRTSEHGPFRRGSAASRNFRAGMFEHLSHEALWVIVYATVVAWGLGLIIEALIKTFTKEPSHDGEGYKDVVFPEKYTRGHELANVSRTVPDGFLFLLAGVVIQGSGYGASRSSIGLLWTIFAIWAALILSKFVLTRPWIDAGVWFVIWVLVIAAFGVAFW